MLKKMVIENVCLNVDDFAKSNLFISKWLNV